MKTQVFTLIAAAALIVAAGCSKDENTAADNGTPVAARITAAMAGEATATPTGKAGQPATRAVNDRWNRDHIGVVVYESPASDMAVRYRNAHYVTASTGTTAEFTPPTRQTPSTLPMRTKPSRSVHTPPTSPPPRPASCPARTASSPSTPPARLPPKSRKPSTLSWPWEPPHRRAAPPSPSSGWTMPTTLSITS